MTAVRGGNTDTSPKENGHITLDPNQAQSTDTEERPVTSTCELTQTWVHFAKTFVLIFPIYALGYFEFSFSWLLIGLVVFFWWRRNTGGKNSRLRRALAFLEQEQGSVQHNLTTSDLPPWVSSRAVQRY